MTADNGKHPTAAPAPVLIGETCVVVHVLHYDTGAASATYHVTAAGRGHLLNRPRTLATMLHEYANDLAARPGLILPPQIG